MQPESLKRLEHVLIRAINEVESFLEKGYYFDEYGTNLMLQKAVERGVEIIGEAIRVIRENDPDVSMENIHQIIATRNRLAHAL